MNNMTDIHLASLKNSAGKLPSTSVPENKETCLSDFTGLSIDEMSPNLPGRIPCDL